MANLITKKEAAKRLGVSVRTLENWQKKKVINALRAGDATRSVRFDANDIDQLFKPK